MTDMTTANENPPLDAVAMHAEAIVQAALEWRWSLGAKPVLTVAEWRLYEACNQYGDKYRGLRAR